jgi:hypothetical protein
MAFPPLPASLPGLTDREAIIDALHRAVLSFDHADESLLHSAVTKDIMVEMPGASPPMSGIPALKETVFDRVAYKLDTTHFLSNFRVDLPGGEGVTTARVTCSAMAQHVRKGKGRENGNKYTSGGLYLCEVVKDGESGLWKIKNWKFNIVWLEGDASVMTGE